MVVLTEQTSSQLGIRDCRVTERLNLEALRQYSNPDDVILTAFDNLEPGQMLVLTDQYNPGWVRELIDERRLEHPQGALFLAEKQEGEYKLYVGIPPDYRTLPLQDDIPENYLG